MKNRTQLLLLVLILILTCTFALRMRQEKVIWKDLTSASINSKFKVKVTYPSSKISSDAVEALLADIPKTEINIADTDAIVVNLSGIFWFCNKKGTDDRKVQTSGGLLCGIYEISKKDIKGTISYVLRPDNNKANLLSNDLGMQFVGQYSNGDGSNNSKVFFGIERTRDAALTANSGKGIETSEGGIYSDNGCKLEFEGSITNILANGSKQTAAVDKFASETDTDPSDKVGSAIYTLSYRIPADKPELSVSIVIKAKGGEIPVGQIDWKQSLVFPTKITNPSDPTKSVNLALESVSAPELMIANSDTSLANVDINKYFTNSCIKSLFNYEFKDTTKAFSVRTPSGRGQVLCTGCPIGKASFYCMYPNNDNLPKEAYEDYTLSSTEIKGTPRLVVQNYSPFKKIPYIITPTQQLTIAARFKFIDATAALTA